MTLTELYDVLKATGFPVAYSHFTATPKNPLPKPPYITYFVASSPSFMADNVVYKKIDDVQIDLYTAKKDIEAEMKLENVLNENELPYDSYETYIESEKIYQKIYEVRLI